MLYQKTLFPKSKIFFVSHFLNLIYLYSLPFIANGIIKSDSVANAMSAVDRKNYCPYAPYHDSPQSIGFAATISAPHMVV